MCCKVRQYKSLVEYKRQTIAKNKESKRTDEVECRQANKLLQLRRRQRHVHMDAAVIIRECLRNKKANSKWIERERERERERKNEIREGMKEDTASTLLYYFLIALPLSVAILFYLFPQITVHLHTCPTNELGSATLCFPFSQLFYSHFLSYLFIIYF